MVLNTDVLSITNGAGASTKLNTGSEVAGAVIGGVLAVLLLTLIIVVIVLFVFWSRKRGGFQVNKSHGFGYDTDNPVYEEAASMDIKESRTGPLLPVLPNPNYDQPGTYDLYNVMFSTHNREQSLCLWTRKVERLHLEFCLFISN